jgi:predicted  nucleic acid-binding Zn-ribbon protein
VEASEQVRVRCLDCGTVYVQAAVRDSGDVVGCPSCGSLGWLAAHVHVSEEFALRHFDAGQRLRPGA